MTRAAVRDAIAAEVERVGEFHVACRLVDGSARFDLRSDEVIPIASMYKVLLGLEVAERIATDPGSGMDTLLIDRGDRSPAGDGLTRLSDPVTMSRRDLLKLSLAWSDNTASDILLRDVGLDSLHRRAHALGLDTLSVIGSCRELLHNAGVDFGYADDAEAEAADWAPRSDSADITLLTTTRASADDLCRLASLLATDAAASPDACALVREAMEGQVWRTRLGSGFPAPIWTRATKTGTLPPWRGEFGIITDPAGRRLALAVVSRSRRRDLTDLAHDLAIGRVGRAAVELVLADSAG